MQLIELKKRNKTINLRIKALEATLQKEPFCNEVKPIDPCF
jgi:hypothetical protein